MLIANIAIATDPNADGYRIFYDDGTQVDSTEASSSAMALSLKKIQAVIVYEKGTYKLGMPYRRIYQGYDSYLIDGIPLLGGQAGNYDSAATAAGDSSTL